MARDRRTLYWPHGRVLRDSRSRITALARLHPGY